MATGSTNFNNELVKCIEELRDKREELNKTIIKVRDSDSFIQMHDLGRGGQGENPKRNLDFEWEASENERESHAENPGSHRVRQNNPGDRSSLHEDPRIFANSSSCVEARICQSYKEEVWLLMRTKYSKLDN